MAKRTTPRKNQISSLLLTFFVLTLFVGSLGFLFYAQVNHFLQRSELFKIKEIVMAPSLRYVDPRALYFLKGRSMFTVDLDLVHRRLRDRYPEVDALRIVRKFPNRLYIAANKREPVAAVALGNRQFLVDRESVVVAPGPAAGLHLPLIQGLRWGKRISFGESLNSAEVDTALEVISAFQSNSDLRAFNIQTIDVRNLARINFVLNGNLSVIIDGEDIEPKMARLGIVLTEGKLNLPEISYIDLRLPDPVLGKKNLEPQGKTFLR